MTAWKDLSRDEQVAALQQVAGMMHISPQAVEKDLWVTYHSANGVRLAVC